MEEVGFVLTGIALTGENWFWPNWNSLEQKKSKSGQKLSKVNKKLSKSCHKKFSPSDKHSNPKLEKP
jgi:hypothetical protein